MIPTDKKSLFTGGFFRISSRLFSFIDGFRLNLARREDAGIIWFILEACFLVWRKFSLFKAGFALQLDRPDVCRYQTKEDLFERGLKFALEYQNTSRPLRNCLEIIFC